MAEHPNATKTREGYEAFARGDLEAVRDFFDADIVWHVPGNSPLAGDYKGVDEVLGFFGKIFELSSGTFKIDVHDILANDDHVVVLAESSAQRDGKQLQDRGVSVYHSNADGKMTEAWFYSADQAKDDEFWS